jgi:choline dehydrogenase
MAAGSDSCDYLVIGAGSGGSAAAGRLAAAGVGSVTLLEAGGTNQRADVAEPDRWFELLSSDANWAYATTPQPDAGGRVHVWSMGKVLGGSSSTNGMMYMRGAPWDYDGWAAEGNPEWDHDTVYAVYKQMESYHDGSGATRGTDGPIRLSTVDGKNPLTAAFVVACQECGIAITPDFNGLEPEGVDVQQLNLWEGKRQDAGTIFVEPQVAAGNLDLRLETTARRLLFEPGTKRVRGVVVIEAGEEKEIAVNKEVIVSGGALASPQLLLLSGVGPADELGALGIETVIDLPGVGDNLHDHIGVPVAFETKEPYPASAFQKVEANAYIRVDPDDEHYDVQVPFQLFPFVPPEHGGFEYDNGYTLYPGLLKPRSRGRLRLAANDPTAPPEIDPAYLSDPEDVRRLVAAIRRAREIGNSPAFAEWRKREAAPGPDLDSDEELEAYVRNSAATYYHPVGTCRMGSGAGTVVDSQLRVHGADNLRVADASVMPDAPSGNTNAPSMMIGWRAAEFIAG